MVDSYWCPVTETSKLIGKKWPPVIVARLLDGDKRFTELERLIPGISAKVLSDSLRDLERAEIIRRTVEPSRPVSISYSLTEKGADLRKVLYEMQEWGSKWLPQPRVRAVKATRIAI